MSVSTVAWAVSYIEKFQFRLVAIPKGTKGPVDPGWNLPGRYVTDPEVARQRWNNGGSEGIGVVLGPSGVCSADIDLPEHAELVLGDLGIDLPALRKRTPTIQGNPARFRLMFKAPDVVLSRKSLVWPPRNPGEKPLTLFELRAGDIQDVLPPTLHPDFGTPYTWLVPPNGAFPPLPEALLELWTSWGSYQKELKGMCPWGLGFNPDPAPRGDGARPSVIGAFNQAHTVQELLEAHGYTRRGKRWISPTSSSGLAGAVILDDGKVYSHHASDSLADGHAHDAFDLYRLLDHGGDTKTAVKAAAEELGVEPQSFGGNSGTSHYDKHGEAAGDHTTKATTTPLIIVRAGELPRIVKAAIEALRGAEVPIYDRGGALYRPVRIQAASTSDGVRRPAGAVVLRLVDAVWVRVKLAAAAEWQKWDAREKEMRPADPPRDIAEIIATQSDLGHWPVLRGVVSHPVLTHEGRVISTPGYDRDTGLLIEITGDWPIPDAPTRDDAVAACARLRKLLRHYPWVAEVDRAVGLSLLLTSIARPVLPAAPMHCADSPEAGSGKSLLVDAASILATDAPASVMDFGRDPVEAGKRLDAMMLAGDAVVAIDNIEVPLEGAVLCQMLTQPARRIRVLGTHTVVTVPCVQMITATGCNLVLRGDIVRRVIITRLDAKTDRPELRVIEQDLIAEVRERRRELVGDLITVMLAYQQAGLPDTGVSPLGGFGAWSRMVRQALIWAGEADPCRSMDQIRGDDPSRQNLALVLRAWNAAFGKDAVTTAEAVERAGHDSNLREALQVVCQKRGVLDTRTLGYWLRAHRDRRSGELVLRAAPGRAGVSRWVVGGCDGRNGCDVPSSYAESVTTNNREGLGTSQTSPPSQPPRTCARCDGEGCDWCGDMGPDRGR